MPPKLWKVIFLRNFLIRNYPLLFIVNQLINQMMIWLIFLFFYFYGFLLIFFLSYFRFKSLLLPLCRYDEEIGPLSPLSVSFAAGISGSVAAATSHCFDTAKSRSQCIVVPKVRYIYNITILV